MMQSQIANNIFNILSKKNTNPTTELVYTNEFTLLVAVVLSARTTDVLVNIATKPLFVKYDTPIKMLRLGEQGLKAYIKSIGLFNKKSSNIIALCKILAHDYGSVIPNNFERLVALPGVGRKTANVILNSLFQAPTIAVDTHVLRVSNRIGLSQSKTPEKVEADLLKVIDKKWLRHAHHWLVLHGRYICRSRKPICTICPITTYCAYYKSTF